LTAAADFRVKADFGERRGALRRYGRTRARQRTPAESGGRRQ